MFLIVGLGNPGKKYINTRHNVGFRVVDELKKKLSFPDFVFDKKSNSLLSKKDEVIMVKPNTYMNLSGSTARALSKYYKMAEESQIIIHDDIDLPLGKIRISKDRGSAGHKGVESIIKDLKTKNFIRIRIGILPENGKPKKAEEFVLKKFTDKEENIIIEVIETAVKAVEVTIEEGAEKAMNKFNF